MHNRKSIANVNSDSLFYQLTVSVNKYRGGCNTINDLYVRASVANKVKNINIKVFNSMPGVNRTRLTVQNESGGCKCGTNKSVCNSKHKWNHDEC